MNQWLTDRAKHPAVALETTILAHGLPPAEAPAIHAQFAEAVREAGASPTLIGVLNGKAIVGMTDDELATMLSADSVHKANRSNLGIMLARSRTAATTVSTTVELAAHAGIRIMATGGIGGVHKDYHAHLDISADLGAIASHPVAVVTSGCKNILDIAATREALETLGVPVVGFRCDTFPAFYQRSADLPLDHRFDDEAELARFIGFELDRTGRGVVVCNPIPADDEIPLAEWTEWLTRARAETEPGLGRDATPAVLARVHELSAGRTVRANIALATSNASLAGRLAAAGAADRP